MVLLRKEVGIRLAFMLEISAEDNQAHQYLQTLENACMHPPDPERQPHCKKGWTFFAE
jgi:hypothetical protein